jgi:hypothetical protein
VDVGEAVPLRMCQLGFPRIRERNGRLQRNRRYHGPGGDLVTALGSDIDLAVSLRDSNDLRAHEAIRAHVAQKCSGKGCHAAFAELVHTCLLVHGGHAMSRQSIPANHLGETDVVRLTQTTKTHVSFEETPLPSRRIDHIQSLSHRQVVVLGPQSRLALRIVGIRHQSPARLAIDREELLRESVDGVERLFRVDWLQRRGRRERVGAAFGLHHRNRGFQVLVQAVAGQLAVDVWLTPGMVPCDQYGWAFDQTGPALIWLTSEPTSLPFRSLRRVRWQSRFGRRCGRVPRGVEQFDHLSLRTLVQR